MKSHFIFLFISLISVVITTNHYSMSSLNYSNYSSTLQSELHYKSKDFKIDDYNINGLRNKTSVALIKDLHLTVSLICDSIIHVTIRDLHNKRYEVPLDNEEFASKASKCHNYLTLEEFGFTLQKDPFSFELSSDNFTYYSWKGGNFLYSDTLIVFETLLTSDYIFGFGERNTKFKLDKGRYTIWPNDTTVTYQDEKNGGWNLMGHQPIGLHRAKNGLYVGLVFLNSNPQDVVIKPAKGDMTSLEHRTIGGIIDYYIVIGKSADEAIMRINQIVGIPSLPPYWSLGWHHSRWGLKSTNDIHSTYKNYRKHQIPIDAMWSDIDVLHKYRNFQLSSPYSLIKSFTQELHKDDAKYIPIVDYGIPNVNDDPYYSMGKRLGNAFILSNYTNSELVSKSWPGKSIILDLFAENGIKVLQKGLEDFDSATDFDGIWLDMNEPGVIDVLPNARGEFANDYPVEKNRFEYIPYYPGARPGHSDLETKTVSLNGYSSLNKELYTMSNTRVLLVREQVKIVHNYLASTGRRPFIISRANTFGHGVHAFHWLGDNKSTFEFMKDSVSGIYNYNIFGVPMTGADICGFHGDTTDELCARWHVLGSIYPFTRNHNVIYQKFQEPWEFSKHTLNAAIISSRSKYSIIRYMYSQLFLISLGESGSCFKPPFFEFPNDEELLTNMENTIMVGHALYFIPIFSASTSDIKAYFPNANWNAFPSGKSVIDYEKNTTKGKRISLSGKFDIIHLFIKGGAIIPYQDVMSPYIVKTTTDLRKRPTQLIINPDANFFSEGDILFDNDDIYPIKSKDFLHVKLTYGLNTVYFTTVNSFVNKYKMKDLIVSKVIFYRGKAIQEQLGKNVSECEITIVKSEVIVMPIIYDSSSDMIIIDMEEKNLTFEEIQLIIIN